jgi:hypothetical protein
LLPFRRFKNLFHIFSQKNVKKEQFQCFFPEKFQKKTISMFFFPTEKFLKNNFNVFSHRKISNKKQFQCFFPQKFQCFFPEKDAEI